MYFVRLVELYICHYLFLVLSLCLISSPWQVLFCLNILGLTTWFTYQLAASQNKSLKRSPTCLVMIKQNYPSPHLFSPWASLCVQEVSH